MKGLIYIFFSRFFLGVPVKGQALPCESEVVLMWGFSFFCCHWLEVCMGWQMLGYLGGSLMSLCLAQ